MILQADMKFHYQCVQIEKMIRNMQNICMKMGRFIWLKTLQMIHTKWEEYINNKTRGFKASAFSENENESCA